MVLHNRTIYVNIWLCTVKCTSKNTQLAHDTTDLNYEKASTAKVFISTLMILKSNNSYGSILKLAAKFTLTCHRSFFSVVAGVFRLTFFSPVDALVVFLL